MTVTVTAHREFVVSGYGTLDALDAHTDAVMDELLKLEGATLADSAVGVDLGRARVEVEVTARGATFEDAVAVADGAVRAAIHAAGGSTPDWRVTQVAQRTELVDA